MSSFRFLADILLKRRLYASPYFELNDPMEGFYLHAGKERIDPEMERALRGAKKQLRVCSLSKWSDHPLLWAHYADGNKGVAVGVEVDDQAYDVRNIKYVNRPPKVGRHNYNDDSAKSILSTKLEAWSYEQEVRVFVNDAPFVAVVLKEVSLGSRLSKSDQEFIIEFCEVVCPEVKIIAAGAGHA